MTKSQEQRMNEFIENRMSGHNGDISDLVKSYMKESYKAAMKEAEVLVEALEFECDNRCSDLNPCNAKEVIKKFKGEQDERY